MIILTVNRHAGPAFVRWMFHVHGIEVQNTGDVIDDHRGVTILTLTPSEVNLFRDYLLANRDTLENAKGILRGLGDITEQCVYE